MFCCAPCFLTIPAKRNIFMRKELILLLCGLILSLAFIIYFSGLVDLKLCWYWQQTVPTGDWFSFIQPGTFSARLAEHYLELLSGPSTSALAAGALTLLWSGSILLIFTRTRLHTPVMHFIPLVLIPLAGMLSVYRLPVHLLISLSLSLVISAVYCLTDRAKTSVLILSGILSSFAVYLIAGSIGFILFFQVLIIRAILLKNGWSLLSLIPLAALPFIFALPGQTTLNEAFFGPFRVSAHDELPWIFYAGLALPLATGLLGWFAEFLTKKLSPRRNGLGRIVNLVFSMLLLGVVSLTFPREEEKKVLNILRAGLENDFSGVLELVSESMPPDRLVQFEVNRALYSKGLLLDRMFYYPQQYAEKGIFMEDNAASRVAVHLSNLYYDLRFANEARHWATEAQMNLIYHPSVLKNLIVCYAAMGRAEAAQKHLNVLKKSWVYREWCDSVQISLLGTKALEHPLINEFRTNEPDTDFFAETGDPVKKLAAFYSQNPDNKLAFELMVAQNLLRHQVGNLIAYIPGFRKFGYEKLPRAVEEAMIIYFAQTRAPSILLAGYSISEQTRQEFREFGKLVAGAGDRLSAMPQVAKYRNTYWYYVMFSSPYASNK